MSDDIESILCRLKPCRPTSQLRDRVLGAVERELHDSPGSDSWQWRLAAAAAVCVLLGVGMNFWAIRSDDSRQTRLYGPRPVPSAVLQVAEAVEQSAGPRMRHFVLKRFTDAREMRRYQTRPLPDYRALLKQLQLAKGTVNDEKADKSHAMDRDQPRRDRRGTFRGQRGVDLYQWQAA